MRELNMHQTFFLQYITKQNIVCFSLLLTSSLQFCLRQTLINSVMQAKEKQTCLMPCPLLSSLKGKNYHAEESGQARRKKKHRKDRIIRDRIQKENRTHQKNMCDTYE